MQEADSLHDLTCDLPLTPPVGGEHLRGPTYQAFGGSAYGVAPIKHLAGSG